MWNFIELIKLFIIVLDSGIGKVKKCGIIGEYFVCVLVSIVYVWMGVL